MRSGVVVVWISAGGRDAAHQPAVDVELNLRAVIGGGDVGPGIGDQGGGGIAQCNIAPLKVAPLAGRF